MIKNLLKMNRTNIQVNHQEMIWMKLNWSLKVQFKKMKFNKKKVMLYKLIQIIIMIKNMLKILYRM